MATLPMWAPEIPAVSWYQDTPGQTGLEAWQAMGAGWEEFPATAEQAQDILGIPVPALNHLSIADLTKVALAVTAPPPKKSGRKSKAHEDKSEDQPQEAAEKTEDESETG